MSDMMQHYLQAPTFGLCVEIVLSIQALNEPYTNGVGSFLEPNSITLHQAFLFWVMVPFLSRVMNDARMCSGKNACFIWPWRICWNPVLMLVLLVY